MSETHGTRQPAYLYAGRLERVVDGDTVDVALDLGMRVQFRTRLRLLGIDTAELNSGDPDQREAARAARAYLEALIATYGDEILVRTDKPDKYGRALAHVVLDPAGAGLDLSATMLDSGFATAYTGGRRG